MVDTVPSNREDSVMNAEAPSTSDQIRRFGPAGLLAVAALLFVVQNTDDASFNFLWFEFVWPLWIILVVFALVGAAIFWFVARRRRKAKATG